MVNINNFRMLFFLIFPAYQMWLWHRVIRSVLLYCFDTAYLPPPVTLTRPVSMRVCSEYTEYLRAIMSFHITFRLVLSSEK